MLHVRLLVLTKYVFHTATNNILNADMLTVIDRFFRSNSSKTFNRNLNSNMRLYRSFLGKDFKIMVQVIPSVLLMALKSPPFTTFRNDQQLAFQVLFKCFEQLVELSSMVYTEKITNNIPAYLTAPKTIIEKLVDYIDLLHHTKYIIHFSQQKSRWQQYC